MNRPLAAFLFGATILAQAALGGESHADVGRYQLVPGVMVPGKAEAQAILLDTETGRTWRMVQDGTAGEPGGLRWLPLEIKLADRINAAAKPAVQDNWPSTKKTLDTNPAFKARNSRLGEDYENDP